MSIQTNKLPDNPQIKVLKSGKTGLFTNYIYKAIPLAFDESMSYYETLCGLLHYLKNVVIPTVNNNADAVAELQSLYEELRTYVDDYFKDLDVQEEINNKLDEMVEDGTLDQIIEQYLNSSAVWGFDTVNDMKNASNLINGSYARTLGFYSKNDGGGAVYKIRQITNEDIVDEMFIFALNNTNLIAELITNKTLHTKQAGLKGDNSTDETIKLNHYFSKQMNNYIIDDGTYIINDTINLPSNCTIKGCGNSIIKLTGISEDYFMFKLTNANNVVIENIHLIGNRTSHSSENLQSGFGFTLYHSQNIVLKDCIAQDLWCDGFYIGNSYRDAKTQETKNIFLENCKAIESGRNGFVVSGGENITISNCYSYKPYKYPGSNLDIEPEGANSVEKYIKNLNVINFTSESGKYGISIYSRNYELNTVKIINYTSIDDQKGIVITSTYNNSNIEILGANIINSHDNGVLVYGNQNPSKLLLKDIVINGCSSNANSSDITKGGITLYGLNNDSDTLDNIVIDNLNYINTNSQYDYYYLISQQHFHLTSLMIKNTVIENKIIAIYDSSALKVENSKIIKKSSTLGRYSIFNKYVNNDELTGITNITVQTTAPDILYEVIFTNNNSQTAGIIFNSSFTVRKGEDVVNNTLYSYQKMVYCKFLKNGDNILILDTNMRTTTPSNT